MPCIASTWNAGQTVRYWREEPLEVDAILDGSWGSWAVEIKTGSILHSDLKGVDEFVRRFPKYRPLVVCDEAGLRVLDRAGLTAQHWRDFLVNGPPKPGATQSR